MDEVKILTVIPVLDESKHLDRCLTSLRNQTFDPQRHRILVLDGGSSDNSREIAEKNSILSENHGGPVIEILDNPGKYVSAARNLALENVEDATHMFEIIGHTWVPEDHLQLRVDDLLDAEQSLGRNIGSMGSKIKPSEEINGMPKSIEYALHSPLGGSGQFAHFKGRETAKSPAFCLHRVEAVKSIGGWDDRWIAGQDHDLNHRLRENDWPVMRSDVSFVCMSKRSTLSGLWGMGRRYGYWRMRQLRVYPKRARLREFLPWIGLISVSLSFILFFLSSDNSNISDNFSLLHVFSDIFFFIPLILLSGYFGVLLTASIAKSNILPNPGIFLSILTLHISFSLGLLTGLLPMKPPINERIKSANNSKNKGRN
tara:strand:- start:5464 stop:6576 length:1113 start_codon:yes stop_codon:yes gene_type:complete